ncbi:membrane protein insertase YidC [Nocardioides jishulii]|uniref:Membrane protein insertase YidC n=2 Tax=Nocardioides jishulii TaxID=2575440 RepID=A0A4U2YSH8_9ACTN|nr:membrane protein insertase YidC [Nocardioides jishulii]QCX28999.1 membrane protein insertase YidC [Nocardioides jishulii]TKI64100.1 membrane protein insertase YidC [Nocardioides jishulii]
MFDFFGAIGSAIMTPLYYIVSVVLVGFHSLFSLVLPKDGGAAWVLSIIGLTLVIRAALIPLFVKQIKSSRNMQLLQPKVRELQKKYGHDRERLAQETMNLYKDAGTNPFASCLPILVQMPIFLALFRMLDQASRNGEGRGVLSDELASQFGRAEIFGVVPISETFWENATGGGSIAVIIVAIVLVLAMTGTTFMTQRQLMAKNMPAEALSGPYAQQQKMLLYVLPLVFGISGVAFPIGVLIYWTVSNLWTMGQQFYVIRNNPAPGTPAEKAKQERDAAKEARRRARRGEPEPVATEVVEVQPESSTKPSARQQPKRKTRSQRKKS